MRFSIILAGTVSLVGFSVATPTTNENAMVQGSQSSSPETLDPVVAARMTADAVAAIARGRAEWERSMVFERTSAERRFLERRLKEKLGYDEKRRVDLQRWESTKLSRIEGETRERLEWDQRAIAAASAGPRAIAEIASQRSNWEQQLVHGRTQRDLDWISRRDSEQRSYDNKRRVDLDGWESWKRTQVELEREQRRMWDRRAIECTNFLLGIPGWCNQAAQTPAYSQSSGPVEIVVVVE